MQHLLRESGLQPLLQSGSARKCWIECPEYKDFAGKSVPWTGLLADVVKNLFAEIVEPSCSIWLDRAVMRPSCCLRACVPQMRQAALRRTLGIRIKPHRRRYGLSASAVAPHGIPSRILPPRIHPYKLQPPTATRFAGGTEDDLKVTE